MTFNFHGLGGLDPVLFISYVFSTELGLDLWRYYFQNAAVDLTAVDDVELDGRKGPRTLFSRSCLFILGLTAPFWIASGLSSAFGGVLSTFIDWLGAAYSFRFRVRFLSPTCGRAV